MASLARGRWIFLALAVVVPLIVGALFQRNTDRLRGLSEHGRSLMATVTSVPTQGGVTYTEYAYQVDGQTYDWNVGHAEAPFGVGEQFQITYLPEVPSVSRPGVYTPARFHDEINPTVQRGFLGGFAAFFALIAFACDRSLRRLRRGDPPRTTPLVAPETAGRVVAGLIMAVLLGVNLDPKVAAKMAQAFGDTPFGVPVVAVVTVCEIVLFAPLFCVFAHLMRLVMASHARGGSLSRAGIVMAVVRADPAMKRSRTIVLAGAAYFIALMAAWIVYADYRGI